MTSGVLKILACIAMALSHTGGVFHKVLPALTVDILYYTGRISFPVFAYLITEGWSYTNRKARYMGRLFFFSLLSQIPYTLAISGTAPSDFEWNVMLTLFLGSCSLAIEDAALVGEGYKRRLLFLLSAFPIGFAFVIPMDYGWAGIASIWLMGLFRENRYYRLAALTFAMGLVYLLKFSVYYGIAFLCMLPAVFLLYRYNGIKGKTPGKYFFYGFYPAHLLVLWAVSRLFIG